MGLNTFFRGWPLVGALGVLLQACSSEPGTRVPPPSGQSGEQLARTWCGSCHAFPEPALLDKQSWREGVLPEMAWRLGLSPPGYTPYARMDPDDVPLILSSNLYPVTPLLAEEDFQKIAAFYERLAPDSLPPQPAKPSVTTHLPGFALKTSAALRDDVPQTTLLRIDPDRRSIFLANRRRVLLRFSADLRVLDTLRTESPAADLSVASDGTLRVLGLGRMDPNDQRLGSLRAYPAGQSVPIRLLDSLARPVAMAFADLNGDGREDFALGQYGNRFGKLSWFEALPGGGYREHALHAQPGTRTILVRDLNGDRRPDLLVLMAQGDEGVWAYLNEGAGNFREERWLRFPPVYGSSHLETADFNGDGYLDLLYCHGDNADYSDVPKPYHAVRIFLNDGRNRFRQRYAFPLHGASMAKAADFDLDGDLDLAVVAYFPNPAQQPDEGFVYLRNEGNFRFRPFTFPGAGQGKWLVLDAGDVDGDGDPDLVLGSFLRLGWVEGFRREYGLLLLENQTR